MNAAPDTPLWVPSAATIDGANLTGYLRWLHRTTGLAFAEYPELWRWSSTDLPAFWASIWAYYGLDRVSGYQEVLADAAMPGARWFTGARLNFAGECLRRGSGDRPALICVAEAGDPEEISWQQLRGEVAAVAATLRDLGVQPGDRVAAYLPNIPAAVAGLLAAASIGAIWTACSPEFGTPSVLARFQQAEPVVLIAADGYRYAGQEHDRRSQVTDLVDQLPSVRHVLTVSNLVTESKLAWRLRPGISQTAWREAISGPATLQVADLPFDHPLWILWSSGTTGKPKGIVQGHGGIIVEFSKALGLGADLKPADRFLFITSTSWMVWNFMIGGLLHGSTIVLYDGSPTYPDVNGAWRIADKTRASMVGTGAAYLTAGQKAAARPGSVLDLTAVRSILQTGSSLPPAGWHWVYEHVTRSAWLQSVCGGTDVCSALAGGSPLLPVYPDRIQCPSLGVALAAWDSGGRALTGQQGELVVTAPMPSMPLYFWNDPDGSRYRASYFEKFPGTWRHGDWVTIEADLSVRVAGRSDSTLNRMGVRMGSADIYAIVEQIPEIADSLVVGVDRADGSYFMPLFVVLAEGEQLDDVLRQKLITAIRHNLSPRHVPDAIVAIPAVPRTLTGKKLEVPVKQILQGRPPGEVSSEGSVTHPEMLRWFRHYAPDARPADTPSATPGSTSACG
jgi:acetoacetyl-CoA synthetase